MPICVECHEDCGAIFYGSPLTETGPTCPTCWKQTASPEAKLAQFDRDAKAALERGVAQWAEYARGRQRERALKTGTCAPSPHLPEPALTGDGTDPPAVTRLGDDPYSTLRREREQAAQRVLNGDFIRPASFGVEQEDEPEESAVLDGVGEMVRNDYCPVGRPSHYNQGDIECLDAMVAAFGEDAVRTYARINAFKYLWRSEYKGGDEDLRKAVFYLRRARGEDPR